MDDFVEFIQYVEDNPYVPIPRNYLTDIDNPLERFTNTEIRQRYRFSRNTIVHRIVQLVRQENLNQGGLSIPILLKVLTTLRFFATGSYQRVCGDLLNISQSSTSRLIKEVSENIASHLGQYIKFPPSNEANRNLFFEIAGFPGVIGCVDGTHIEIKNPGGQNAEVYRNRKGWMSLNVQVVAGPRCEILDAIIRWPGSAHDSRIFNNSSIKMKLEQGRLRGILLGDSAYQQTHYTYTSVLNPTTRAENRYNSAHIKTRNVVERTFGIWKGRFRCLQNVLNYNVNSITRIITSTAILHNIAIEEQAFLPDEDIVREVPNPPLAAPNGGENVIRAAFIQRHFEY